MAVINQINLVNNVGESETYDIETKITETIAEYMRNQQKISTCETVTVQTSGSNKTFTAEYDGIVTLEWVAHAGAGIREVSINGNVIATVGLVYYPNGTAFTVYSFPVNKGDIISFTSASYSTNYVRYYKLRDYSAD